MIEKIVEAALHEYIRIQMDPAVLDQLLQAYHVSAMRSVSKWTSEYLPRRLNLHRNNSFAA